MTTANFKKSNGNTVKGNINITDPKVKHLRNQAKQTLGKND